MLLAACNKAGSPFVSGHFTFTPPVGFEEPFWHPNETPTERYYYLDDSEGLAMLAVRHGRVKLDAPLRTSEEQLAANTCTMASFEGWRESRQITSSEEVEAIEVASLPAGLLRYKGIREGEPRDGLVACMARNDEWLMVAFEGAEGRSEILSSVIRAIRGVAVPTPNTSLERTREK